MGRKAAPQPLTLAKSNTSTTSNANSNSNSNPTSLSATERDEATPAVETASSAGISTGTSLSPVDSRSTSSPRASPFTSRFAAKRSHKNKGALQQTGGATSQLHSTTSSPTKDNPESAYLTINTALQQQQQHQQQPQQQPLSQPPSSSGPPPPDIAPLRHANTDGSRKLTKSGLFSFNKATKPLSQIHAPHQSESRGRLMSSGNDSYGGPKHGDGFTERPATSYPSRSNHSLSTLGDNDSATTPTSARRSKPKSFGLLGRQKSMRDKDRNGVKEAPVPLPISATSPEFSGASLPLRTAPVSAQDRAFRDMMASNGRNRSEDRAPPTRDNSSREQTREREHRHQQFGHRENSSTFFSGLRVSSTRAADMISKGLFGKSSRNTVTVDKDTVDDEHYVLKTINLPLVQQTRKTRISKRLEDSRDKTEFWMPAFPWRAIDYLNYKGCEVEGLYRVPGSGPQVKKWQRKFDEELDVDLFKQDDLYDINIVGSMLKAWLRELPDELFPKASQERISRECAGADTVPQMLIDELSNLSPYNYYLLFAITCHLSLLLAHSDKNKMDFRNLCICFQPCMKIDAFCFKFLVCDWRECWKGCSTEDKFIDEEYRALDLTPPGQAPKTEASLEEGDRQLSSSASSKPSEKVNEDDADEQDKEPISNAASSVSVKSSSSISTNLSGHSDHHNHKAKANNDMRPLSPIKPLSPLGF